MNSHLNTSNSSKTKEQDLFIDFNTDRYGSLKLIDWFKIDNVKNANVLVVGAGAIGNEVLKNLTLLGVGNIFIYDRDTIEMSNLTRSVLFRAEDCNRLKAEVAAEMIQKINPDINVVWNRGDIHFDLGLGLIRRMNVVIGCLDNRTARMKINTDCFRAGRPWVDAGIGQLNGQVRVFSPDLGACYECSFTADDYQQAKMPCNHLASLYSVEGKIPTTPTIASIVAGIQVQEVLKLLDYENWQGRTLVSHEMIFNGTIGDCMRVELVRNTECSTHDSLTDEQIVELPEASVKTSTFEDLLDMIENKLGEGATIQLNFDCVLSADCSYCNDKEYILKPIGLFFEEHLACQACKNKRSLDVFTIINRKRTEVFEQVKNLKLCQLNIPPLDILTGCGKDGKELAFEITGDKTFCFKDFSRN